MSRVIPAKYDDLVQDSRGRTYYRTVPGKTSRVAWWWSTDAQLWVVLGEDTEGNQIGTSQYVHRSRVPGTVDYIAGKIAADKEADL